MRATWLQNTAYAFMESLAINITRQITSWPTLLYKCIIILFNCEVLLTDYYLNFFCIFFKSNVSMLKAILSPSGIRIGLKKVIKRLEPDLDRQEKAINEV